MANLSVLERDRFQLVESGSLIEAIAGFAAIVLALVGLGKVMPADMAAIAVIIVGVALVLEGAAVAARYLRLASESVEPTFAAQGEVSGVTTAEFVGGAAGIVLGVLSLIGLYAAVLIPVSAIVYGGSLLIGSTASARLNKVMMQAPAGQRDPWLTRLSQETMNAASGAEFMIGAAATVLGILAVVGVGPWLILSLVALLVVGVAVLVTGTAMSAKTLSLLRRHS